MELRCVNCEEPIEAGDYRLVGVEEGSWESRYAHRGSCESEARDRFARPEPAPKKRGKKRKSARGPEVEEITLGQDEESADEPLPWFGMERRR